MKMMIYISLLSLFCFGCSPGGVGVDSNRPGSSASPIPIQKQVPTPQPQDRQVLNCADSDSYSLMVVDDQGRDAQNINVLAGQQVKWTIKLPNNSQFNSFALDSVNKTKTGFEISTEWGSRYLTERGFHFVCRDSKFFLKEIRAGTLDKGNPSKHSIKTIKIDPNVDIEKFDITQYLTN